MNLPPFTIPAGAVVLINGPSGSGKSSMMAEVISRFDEPATLATPSLEYDRPVIEQWSGDVQRVTETLGMVGLADPFTWARIPHELSEGQRLRLELADLIQSGGDIVVYDEWLATLDRITAKAVAFAIGKMLRKRGIGALFVTSHDDLVEDLQPDLVIKVGWQPEPQIVKRSTWNMQASFASELKLVRGDRQDWLKLKHLHYAAGDPATIHSVYKLAHRDLDHPAAVAVFSYPDLHSAARNLATDDEYQIRGSRLAAQRLNREVLRMSRIVVAPELRCCGLAHRLINEAAPLLNVRYVECTTEMGRFSPFLEKAGFREVPQTPANCEAELQDWAEQVKVPPHVVLDPALLEEFISGLSVRQARKGRKLVWQFFHHFALHRRTRAPKRKKIPGPDDKRWAEAFDLAARRIRERPVYYILGPLTMTSDAEQPTAAVKGGT